MHFRFAQRTSAIRYYSLSRQMSRGVLNFCNTHRRNQPVRCFRKLSVSSDNTLEGISRNPNRSRDHLLSAESAPEHPTAKTLLIVAFIFGACPCAIRHEIRPAYCHPLASFLRCMRYSRETRAGPSLPSKQREACKTMEKERWYCRVFRYVRWFACKENLSEESGEETGVFLNRTICSERDVKQVNFIAYMRVYKDVLFLLEFFLIADNIIECYRLR